jgi:hypothetical protein
MTSFVPESLKALPEPVQSGLVGAALGAGASYMEGGGDLMSYALGYGALSAAAAWAAPMLTADPMVQYAAVAGLGAGAQFVAPSYVPGGLLHSAGIPSASLYVARSFM